MKTLEVSKGEKKKTVSQWDNFSASDQQKPFLSDSDFSVEVHGDRQELFVSRYQAKKYVQSLQSQSVKPILNLPIWVDFKNTYYAC